MSAINGAKVDEVRSQLADLRNHIERAVARLDAMESVAVVFDGEDFHEHLRVFISSVSEMKIDACNLRSDINDED